MPESLTSREVLIYLYVKKKGNWREIYKALSEKEKLPSDLTTCHVEIDKFLTKHPKTVTLVDDDFPTALKSRKHPPFVLPYEGELGLADYDQMVAIEDCTLALLFTKHKIRHCFVDEKGSCHIRIPSTEGESPYKELVFEEDREHSILTMAAISKKFVATQGDRNFVTAFEDALDKSSLFALPGNSGCECNKLIKEGWHLCDCPSDVFFATEPVDPAPKGGTKEEL